MFITLTATLYVKHTHTTPSHGQLHIRRSATVQVTPTRENGDDRGRVREREREDTRNKPKQGERETQSKTNKQKERMQVKWETSVRQDV